MTDQRDSRNPAETDSQRTARHLNWLSIHAEVLSELAGRSYGQHGRGYVRTTSVEGTAAFIYMSPKGAHPLVAEMLDTYDPARQVVVVIKDPPGPVGLYKVRMIRVTPAAEG